MMHMLKRFQGTAKQLFHHQTMLKTTIAALECHVALDIDATGATRSFQPSGTTWIAMVTPAAVMEITPATSSGPASATIDLTDVGILVSRLDRADLPRISVAPDANIMHLAITALWFP